MMFVGLPFQRWQEVSICFSIGKEIYKRHHLQPHLWYGRALFVQEDQQFWDIMESLGARCGR